LLLTCLVLLGVIVVGLGFLVWRAWTPSDRLLRQHLLDRYVVTVDAGETFTGLLADVDGRTVILRAVSVLIKDGSESPVDGDVVLRRESISYMKKPS